MGDVAAPVHLLRGLALRLALVVLASLRGALVVADLWEFGLKMHPMASAQAAPVSPPNAELQREQNEP